MEISIEYLAKHNEPSVLILTPEEYYDPIEENETYENHAVPKYDIPDKYLEIKRNELVWLKLSICGSSDDIEILFKYYEDGETWMSHRKDACGFEEIIHSIQESEHTCHVIRTSKDLNGSWSVSYNGIIYDLKDGSQKEERFDSII